MSSRSFVRMILGAAIAVVLGMTSMSAAALPAGVEGSSSASTQTTQPPANIITVENRNPGTTAWRIPWSGKTVGNDTAQQIKGYFSATSVPVGSSINLHARSTVSSTFTYSIYRLGWYGGTGGRLMLTSDATPVASQQPCLPQQGTGLIECAWSVAAEIQIPDSWVSGIYVAVLTAGNYQNYATFTVTDDRQDAMLAVQPVHTHQAYNGFPGDGRNGKSLYASNSYGFLTVQNTTAAVKVSADRPYSHSGISYVLRDDHPFVQYAESRGFNVTYATDTDYHARPQIATGQRTVVFVGHSEYWTMPMYDTVRAARAAGRHVSWFGANNVFYHVRLEPNRNGVANRTMVSYKVPGLDPNPDKSLETVQFRLLGKAEQELMAQQYASPPGLTEGEHPWVVRAANSWFYRGTGLRNGSSIPGIVGIETDYRQSAFPMPVMSQHFVLAQSPTRHRRGGPGIHEAALYRAPTGSWIFDAGTLHYTRGLGSPGYVDRRVQTWTTNLLTRQMKGSHRVLTSRIGGANRYATSAMISQATFGPGVGNVYVTTGMRFPDAVAASAATKGEVPILLTRPEDLPPETIAELRRLRPVQVTVLGNVDAVSTVVEERIAAELGVPVRRIFGANRYETAALISADAFEPGVPAVYVATGGNFPDALAAGAVGAQNNSPVLLTAPSTLAPAARAEIARLNPQRIIVVGNSAAVSDGIAQDLRSIAPVVRLGGSNRYETAQAIVRDQISADSVTDVVMATGMDFPDALTGGPMVAARGGALVLTRATLDAQDAEEVVRNDPARITFLGSGQGWLSTAIADQTKRLFDVADGVTTPTVIDPKPPIWTAGTGTSGTQEMGPLSEDALTEKAIESSDQLPWLADDR